MAISNTCRRSTGESSPSFRARTDEKANIEVQLYDEAGKQSLMTFAFLGKYHSVLDGVKSAILKENRFVKVDSRMWIFPGRFFEFEVRGAKNQYQMFLNGELGPFFVDEKPLAEMGTVRLRIVYSGGDEKEGVRFDDVRLTIRD